MFFNRKCDIFPLHCFWENWLCCPVSNHILKSAISKHILMTVPFTCSLSCYKYSQIIYLWRNGPPSSIFNTLIILLTFPALNPYPVLKHFWNFLYNVNTSYKHSTWSLLYFTYRSIRRLHNKAAVREDSNFFLFNSFFNTKHFICSNILNQVSSCQQLIFWVIFFDYVTS